MAATVLASYGYKFIPGPSGRKGDFVLRKVSDESAGFSFEGPDHFASLAKATFLWVREGLVSVCGLEPLPGMGPATPYATPGLLERDAPLLLLCCGDVPGGDAGSWSRRLCINEGTVTGSMFEYIFRAQQRGWSVVVADSHAHADTSSPHAHLAELWQKVLSKCKAASLLIVGHSYGGPNAVGLLKAEPAAAQRLAAFVGTDAMGWGHGGWSSTHLDESAPSLEEVRSNLVEGGQKEEDAVWDAERLQRYKPTLPAAFEPMSAELNTTLVAVARNYVASDLAPGTPIRTDAGMILHVAAGSSEHGSTTMACVDSAFEYLERGAAGTAAQANAEARA